MVLLDKVHNLILLNKQFVISHSPIIHVKALSWPSITWVLGDDLNIL
jgi:hypothetical protein